MPTLSSTRQQLRHRIRQLRRALSPAQQQQAAEAVCQRALTYPPLQAARTVALFLSIDGELDTQPLITALWRQGKTVCLPVLHPFCPGQLLFLRYDAHTPLRRNRLGIAEPPLDIRLLVPLAQLDLLLMPLVAFDRHGQRLGMGGGFYDRTLQQHQRYGFHRAGLAHDIQRVENLPAEAWDVPLPAVITPGGIWTWSS
ncbi:5-formyltetrahydrofolate cyclo-ligase [Pantoea sp. 1.19]|uniref:5-formyltetrahydrofolate cyclo-ligase n=1 Tax=Pantoea sp. 1.19 TaxID=1925589 RepID=UPI000948E03A|nr:5-formyltetrahydrofolate cyclo-ligase [Pantoea sp. 1.19]